MGVKRIVRWGEHVYPIETTVRENEIELTAIDDEPTAPVDVKSNPTSRFCIEPRPDHQYKVTERRLPEGGESPALDFAQTGAGKLRAHAMRDGSTVWVAVAGETYRLDIEDVKRGRSGSLLGADEIRAPMTGTVLSVLAKVGDTVEAGQPVLVVEAMKMEHTLKAPRAGLIEEVACSEGDQVEAQSVLVSFAAVGAETKEGAAE